MLSVLLPQLIAAQAQLQSESGLIALDEFRSLTAAGRYAEALPYAEQLVASADDTHKLVAALNNLAATHYQLGDLAAAESNYLRSLISLEDSQGISSPGFVVPLAGLATVYAAQNRHEQAVDFYRQALAVNRRAHGLFNPAQTDLLEALTSSHMALGHYPAAEAERRYLVQIAARTYGAEDPRIVPALAKLANWYESVHNYIAARLVYARMYEIARQESGNSNPAVIDALLGIGRMYRLQFADDPGSAARPYSSVNQVMMKTLSGIPWTKRRDFVAPKLDRQGYKALTRALDALEDLEDPPAKPMISTLLELGDWAMASKQPDLALQHYSRAETIFRDKLEDGDNPPLVAPRLVIYHPPPSSVTHRLMPRAQVIVRQVNFTLTVTEKGETRDVVLSGSDANSMQAFQLQQALQKASYRPRFEDGRPVATSGVTFTTQWFELLPTSPEVRPAGSG